MTHNETLVQFRSLSSRINLEEHSVLPARSEEDL
jgi:hypothetical protein